MARMPGATWHGPVPNEGGSMSSIRGVVLHIMEGTLTGTDSWFHNSQAQASSHFGTGKDGRLWQWVDSSRVAWAEAAGNSAWISIENEGHGGDRLTDDQLDRCAQVLAWAHTEYGVPLQSTSSTSGRGLGHHSMGGSAWGGHTSCPGSKIIAQKAEIVRRAKDIVEGDDVSAKDVWSYEPEGKDDAGHEWQMVTYQRNTNVLVHQLRDHQDALEKKVDALTALVEKLATK